ncbi:MAG: peptidoglycan DD-metalloendopeptidase family protein [Thermovirgaceae bacterium]|nr:peptidoglycan DD-metalloendopeptidase family protein [Thermovirgaceae bacterium]
MKKKACLAALVFVILLSGFIAASEASTGSTEIDARIESEESRLDAIEKQIAYHQRQITEAQKKERGLLDDLSRINQNVVLLRQKISVLDLQREKTEIRIRDLTSEIEVTEASLEKTKGYLASRFQAIYKYGGVAEFNLLLSAASTHEAMNNAFLLGRIAREDERRIREMSENKKRLESARREMGEQKILLEGQKDSLKNQQASLKDSESQRKKSLDTLTRQKQLHQRAAKELEDSQRELQNKIKDLLAQKRRGQETRVGVVAPIFPTGGRLAWPVRGDVTSSFGTRVHPVFKTKIMHTGIDIKAAEGTPVKAAAPGEVLFAGWLRGYGQIVILDHGRDLTTVYAHLSKIRVDEGKIVRDGEIIGNVGSTGVTSGPHLHFEVRINGDAKNPLGYLAR